MNFDLLGNLIGMIYSNNIQKALLYTNCVLHYMLFEMFWIKQDLRWFGCYVPNIYRTFLFWGLVVTTIGINIGILKSGIVR